MKNQRKLIEETPTLPEIVKPEDETELGDDAQFVPASQLSDDPRTRDSEIIAQAGKAETDTQGLAQEIGDIKAHGMKRSVRELVADISSDITSFSAKKGVVNNFLKLAEKWVAGKSPKNATKAQLNALKEIAGINDAQAVKVVDEMRKVRAKYQKKAKGNRTMTRNAVVVRNTETGRVLALGAFRHEKGPKHSIRVNKSGRNTTLDALLEKGYELLGYLHLPTNLQDKVLRTWEDQAAFDAFTMGRTVEKKTTRQEVVENPQGKTTTSSIDSATAANRNRGEVADDRGGVYDRLAEGTEMLSDEDTGMTAEELAAEQLAEDSTIARDSYQETDPDANTEESDALNAEAENFAGEGSTLLDPSEEERIETYEYFTDEVDEELPFADQEEELIEAVENYLAKPREGTSQGQGHKFARPAVDLVFTLEAIGQGLNPENLDRDTHNELTRYATTKLYRIVAEAAFEAVTQSRGQVNIAEAIGRSFAQTLSPAPRPGAKPAQPEGPDGTTPVNRVDLASQTVTSPREAPSTPDSIDEIVKKAKSNIHAYSKHAALEFIGKFGLEPDQARGITFLLERLEAMNPVAFQSLKFVFSPKPPTNDSAKLAEIGDTPAYYDSEDNTIWISDTRHIRPDQAILSLVHEIGHYFTEKIIPHQAAEAYRGLSNEQRKKAWNAYRLGSKGLPAWDGKITNINDPIFITARHEWAAMQFTRIIRAGEKGVQAEAARMRSEGIPDGLVEQFLTLYRVIRATIRRLIGTKDVSSPQLDKAVREMFGVSAPNTEKKAPRRKDLRAWVPSEQKVSGKAKGTPVEGISEPAKEGQLSYGDLTEAKVKKMPSIFAVNPAAVDAKLPNYGTARNERLGLGDYTNRESPELELDSAWGVWDILKGVKQRLTSTVIAAHHSWAQSKQGKKWWSLGDPDQIISHIESKGYQIPHTEFDERDGDDQIRVAAFASMELSAMQKKIFNQLEKNVKALAPILRKEEKGKELTPAQMEIKQAVEAETAALKALYKALDGERDELAVSYGGHAINDIRNNTHLAVPYLENGKWKVNTKPFQIDEGNVQIGDDERRVIEMQADLLKDREQAIADLGTFMVQTIEAQYENLTHSAFQKVVHRATSFAKGLWLTPVAQRLQRLGLVSTTSAQRRLFHFQSILDSHRNDVARLGKKGQRLRKKLMQKTGLQSRPDAFDAFSRYLANPAKRYMQQRGATYNGLFTHLGKTPAKNLLNAETRDLLEQWLNNEAEYSTYMSKISGAVLDSRLERMNALTNEVEAESRKPISKGTMTFMQVPSLSVLRTFVARMARTWETGSLVSDLRAFLKQGAPVNDPSIQQALQISLNDPQGIIVQEFLQPLIESDRSMPFVVNADPEGTEVVAASREQVINAWQATEGDPAAFLMELSGDNAEVLEANLGSLQSLYRSASAIIGKADRTELGSGKTSAPPHTAIDARLHDDFPAGWLDFSNSTETDNIISLSSVAFHRAFGRDGKSFFSDLNTAMKDYEQMATSWEAIQRQVFDAPENEKEALLAALVKADPLFRNKESLPKRIQRMQEAKGAINELRDIANSFESVFRSQMGPSRDIGPLMEGVYFMVKGILNGPRSALVQINQIYFPMMMYGFSETSFKQMGRALKQTGKSILGAAMQSLFGAQIFRNDPYQRRLRDVRGVDPNVGLSFRESVGASQADLGANGRLSEPGVANFMGRMLRRLSNLYEVSFNFRKTDPADALYGSFNPFSIFKQTIDGLTDGAIAGTWKDFDTIAERAIKYVGDHSHLPASDPQSPFNPNFKFTPGMLGYNNKLFGMIQNERAFMQLNQQLNEVVGTSLEALALRRWRKPLPEGAYFTKPEYQRLAQIALTYIVSEGNYLTTRSAMAKSPALRFLTPILGWSIQAPHTFARMFKNEFNEADRATVLAGIYTLAAGVLPASLLFSLFMDWFDEEALEKKSSIRPLFDGNAKDFMQSATERFVRWGPLGLPGEAGVFLMNVGGEGGDTRTLSLDNRVMLANSFRSIIQAVGGYMETGEATYATTYRPILSAVGGNGVLQSFQLASAMFDWDNPESRLARRTNASNYLRAYGKIADLEVRNFRGAVATPTPMTPHVTRMILAAMSNSRTDFQSSWMDAVNAARKMKKPDPVEAVAQSFGSRHPLRSIFRTIPTEAEVQRLLGMMPVDGRRDVTEALRLYNIYAQSLGITPTMGKQEATLPVSSFNYGL
jgi:hypothetical protein